MGGKHCVGSLIPDDAQSPSMKIPLNTQHDRPALVHTLSLVSPLPSELQRGFDGLCASVHGQNHVVPEKGRNLLGELAKDRVVERP